MAIRRPIPHPDGLIWNLYDPRAWEGGLVPTTNGIPYLSELANGIAEIQKGLDRQQDRPKSDLSFIHRLAIAAANGYLESAKRILRWSTKGIDFSDRVPPPLAPTP
jgi:hypothetical protein